jgi:hypothetical protein
MEAKWDDYSTWISRYLYWAGGWLVNLGMAIQKLSSDPMNI